MKKFIAITLAVLVMMSAVVCSFSVSAASNATVSYSFTGDEKSIAGFAEGTISVKNNTSSTANYYLYWADSTKALDGYRQIAILSVAAGSTGTYKMLDHTAIPPKATQLIAIQSSSTPANKNVSNAAGTYTIPASKRLSDTTTLYTFGAVSDPQIANDSYGSGSYPNDETHWAAALETLAKRNVDFTVSSGDTVNDQNGGQTYAGEYQRYQKILADSSYVNPIWEANGNHDVHVNWKGTAPQLNKPFVMGTGVDNTVETIKANTPYFEMTEPKTGDHFIFMALEGGFYTDENTQFSTAQLDWLEGLLKKYKNDGKNIFIMEHANVLNWGSGDLYDGTPYYDLPLDSTNANVKRFISLMETYKECVIITGHTHLELGAHLNYSDNNGSSAVMMHNSAIGGVRRLVNGSIDRSAVLGMSEGYLVDVYEDCIIFNGTNMYHNEIMPDCTYIIPFDTTANGEIPTDESTEPTETQKPTQTQAPTQAGEVTEGYYLVGSLNGKSLWDASTLTADRKLRANPNAPGEYYLEWTFYMGDELKVAHYNGTSIDKWFNDGGDNYKIGSSSKVGDCTVYFNPSGKSSWSYTWFTVQQGDSGIVEPTQATTEPTEATTEPTEATTEPTEATTEPTEATTEPTQATTEPTQATTEPTTKPTETQAPTKPSWLLYGDVNLDGDVAVVDATYVQRKVAQLEELYDEQLINGDVDADGLITVLDATYIQRKVAKMLDKFPVEEAAVKTVAVTGASDVATLLATAKADLSKHYTFSSFDQYQALKKAVKQLETYGDTSQTAYNNLNAVYTEFVEILEALGAATGDTIDVYFTNIPNWSTVNAYVWSGSTPKAAWPGEAMTYVETNEFSQKVYKITLETGKYSNIIFNNGSTQTVDLALSNTNNEGFYTTTQSGGKYLCETYVYGG